MGWFGPQSGDCSCCGGGECPDPPACQCYRDGVLIDNPCFIVTGSGIEDPFIELPSPPTMQPANFLYGAVFQGVVGGCPPIGNYGGGGGGGGAASDVEYGGDTGSYVVDWGVSAPSTYIPDAYFDIYLRFNLSSGSPISATVWTREHRWSFGFPDITVGGCPAKSCELALLGSQVYSSKNTAFDLTPGYPAAFPNSGLGALSGETFGGTLVNDFFPNVDSVTFEIDEISCA